MQPSTPPSLKLRPAPDAILLVGSLLAAAGYVLPWFKKRDGYAWSYSGRAYAELSTGGGWTLITFVFLTVAAVAGLWAGRHTIAALWALTGVVGAGFVASAVVAASFSNIDERDSINYLSDLPFDVGLPVLAVGLGLGLAGGVRAIVRTSLPAAEERGEQ